MKQERDKYILKHEYIKFIENCPEGYKLFWRIIFNAGLRISEGLNISINDIIYNENKLLIKTLKRKNHPIIPIIIPEDLIQDLKLYIIKNESSDKIFNFSRQFAWKLFKSICKKSNLNPKYSPHALRHAHGVMIADITNGNMVEIKNRLRHSSIKSTEFYIHVSEKKQKELVNNIENYLK